MTSTTNNDEKLRKKLFKSPSPARPLRKFRRTHYVDQEEFVGAWILHASPTFGGDLSDETNKSILEKHANDDTNLTTILEPVDSASQICSLGRRLPANAVNVQDRSTSPLSAISLFKNKETQEVAIDVDKDDAVVFKVPIVPPESGIFKRSRLDVVKPLQNAAVNDLNEFSSLITQQCFVELEQFALLDFVPKSISGDSRKTAEEVGEISGAAKLSAISISKRGKTQGANNTEDDDGFDFKQPSSSKSVSSKSKGRKKRKTSAMDQRSKISTKISKKQNANGTGRPEGEEIDEITIFTRENVEKMLRHNNVTCYDDNLIGALQIASGVFQQKVVKNLIEISLSHGRDCVESADVLQLFDKLGMKYDDEMLKNIGELFK